MTKRNQKTAFYLLTTLLVGTALVLIIVNNNQKAEITKQSQQLEKLTNQLLVQQQLLKTDALLVEGHYEEAIVEYEQQETALIEDDAVGVGLRLAIAQKFLELENVGSNVAAQSTLIKDEEVEPAVNLPEVEINKLDSLGFVLEKTKVQLTRLKKQLAQKAFGEYLTFTNGKGSQLHYVGQVKEGKANGYGVALLNTGSRYVGEWQNNERHGHGTYYWKDGEYYEGTYSNDKRNGQGTYYWPNGEKYVGQWKNDQRSGKGAFYSKDGKIMTSGVWENDKMLTTNTKKKKERSKEKELATL